VISLPANNASQPAEVQVPMQAEISSDVPAEEHAVVVTEILQSTGFLFFVLTSYDIMNN
jgi:membrane protein CcdC involved in cytochrome C biogenesis